MKRYKETVGGVLPRRGGGRDPLICIPDSRVQVWKPKWDKKLKLKTIIRVTGSSPDGKQFLPYRYSGEPSDFSDFVVSVPLWTGGTTKEFTFIGALADPDSPGDILDPELNPTPATLFHDTLAKMFREDETLKARLDKMRGNPKLRTWGLVQCILLQHGAKDYRKRPRLPVLMQLSWSAKSALEKLLNEETEDYTDPDNFEQRFTAGDIVHADTGHAISFYNATASDDVTSGGSDGAAPDWSNAGGKTASDDKSTTVLPHYGCDREFQMPLPRTEAGNLMFHAEGSLFTPWEKLLRFFTLDEMAQLVVMACEDMPEVLTAAFHSHPEWLPKYLKGESFVRPGDVPPAAPTAPAQTAPVPSKSDNSGVHWGGAGTGSEGEPSSEPDNEPAFVAAALADQTGQPEAAAPGVTEVPGNKPEVQEALARLQAVGAKNQA